MHVNQAVNNGILNTVNHQIKAGSPAVTHETYNRLTQFGYGDNEARRLIANVLQHEMFMMANHGQDFDPTRYGAMLKQLPRLPAA
ncbi:hypothetical protein [Magnetococcus sp. PR-3]|uniref:hypothetical protein n=1 Tax=Magnetococcus sp. PR-3 TaxID=3120355 RepID=UPI002FCE4C48